MRRAKIDASEFDTPQMRALIQEELESLKNDSLVYPVISEELKLTSKEVKRFLAALLDYQEDVHYCASCPGLENCKKAHPHFSLRLERDGELLIRHYDPCEEMMSLSSFQKRYIRCTFPSSWRDKNLNDIERSVSARDNVVGLMAKIQQNLSNRWIYLTGSNGSGKTNMLACFSNDITKAKGKGVFTDTESLFSELKEKSINDRQNFEELLKTICESSILVLDDFGNEFKTEYVFTSILFPILSYRDKANLPTAFASDFKIDQIVSMYRSKIGFERASQLKELLVRRCKKELDVTGVPFH